MELLVLVGLQRQYCDDGRAGLESGGPADGLRRAGIRSGRIGYRRRRG
jgi:hypothetical protein